MPEMCVGITDGASEMEDQARLPEWRRFAWGVRFGIDQGIVCENRDDLELVVEGYEPPAGKYPKQKPVRLSLFRKEPRTLMWQGMALNTDLCGMPRLKWVEA